MQNSRSFFHSLGLLLLLVACLASCYNHQTGHQEVITQLSAKQINYYPSPAVFVYTLANIVTGEIAIRNQLKGETTFYVLDKENPKLMEEIVADAFQDQATQSVLTGWVDLKDTQQFNAKLYIIKK